MYKHTDLRWFALFSLPCFLVACTRPNPALLHQQTAMALVRNHQFAEAESEFRAALQTDPNFAEAHNHIAQAAIRLQQYDKAVAEAQKAIALNPNVDNYHFHLGTALLYQKQYKPAIPELQTAIRLDKIDDAALFHCFLGKAFYFNGQRKDAREQWNTAAASAPGSAATLASHYLEAYFPK